MKKLLIHVTAVGALALAAGCTTPGQRGTEVTRFHLGEIIPAQQVNIEPIDPADADSLEFRSYAFAVAGELARIGFAETALGEAEMIAAVRVSRGNEIAPPQRSPVSIGIGGGSFGNHVGVGVGTSFGVGGSRGGEVTVTRLDVQLKRRSDGTVVWEGSATRADPPGAASPTAIVGELAAALFQGFPGESGRTITVE